MSCSCDHPRTQRRLPFFDSNNRHSPESRAAVLLDISVHAHGVAVRSYGSRISRAEKRKGTRENRTARLIASKRANITVLRARLMRQWAHTPVTHLHHHVAHPRKLVLWMCSPSANYKRDTLADSYTVDLRSAVGRIRITRGFISVYVMRW